MGVISRDIVLRELIGRGVRPRVEDLEIGVTGILLLGRLRRLIS
jgi:hypothetical protein